MRNDDGLAAILRVLPGSFVGLGEGGCAYGHGRWACFAGIVVRSLDIRGKCPRQYKKEFL
ncbi:MAG: hypothetical protein C0631_15130 [Sedimenticola sp.]|nr:MAG: hypothetical protein C0631_15130 [Sedimenticola sp.]